MEVPHHAHTPRKKWIHYFWEFFMLFLAVFCGFLAENQREHYVEHQRERKYMGLMVEDLETDTSELTKAIQRCETVARYSDSVLIFLTHYKPAGEVPYRLANYIGLAGQRMNLVNTDRTSSQLKNAGALRLIRKKNVNDSILFYWKQINETYTSLDRYMKYRDASRSIAFKLWVIPPVYTNGFLIPKDSLLMLRVIDTDNKKWDELTNLMAISGAIARETHLANLKTQFSMAKNLIALIKEEYHFK